MKIMLLTPKIQKAIDYAAEKHLGQKRKAGGEPYIVHPFAVAWILNCFSNDEDIIVAGLLHDILEDVKGSSFEELALEFGEKSANIVKEVTEDKDPNIQVDSRKTWEKRKKKYLEHLKTASREALLVSAADKIHNLQSMVDVYKKMGDGVWEVFNSRPERKLWFYEEVLEILKKRLGGDLTRELERVVENAKKIIAV